MFTDVVAVYRGLFTTAQTKADWIAALFWNWSDDGMLSEQTDPYDFLFLQARANGRRLEMVEVAKAEWRNAVVAGSWPVGAEKQRPFSEDSATS